MELYKKHISDLGRVITGKTPRTSIKENYGGIIPFLTPSDNMSFKYAPRTTKTLSELGLKEVKSCLLPPSSICVSCIGSDLGKVVMTTRETITNQQINSIIPNKDNDPDFIYYLMCIVGKHINALSKTSTAVPIINKSTFSEYEVYVPDKENQTKIANILSSLDDKIELNRRINDNLEQQAQALFKSWFVDFEPWGGKMPNDWKEGTLLDIADYLNGLAMQKYPSKEGFVSLPVLKIKELGQGYCDDASDRCTSTISSQYIVNDGDVIFSWSGTLLVDIWCGGVCGLNQHLYKVTSKSYPKWFYLYWTISHLEKFRRIASDKAVTMGHIKRGDLEKAKVLIPPITTIVTLSNQITPMIENIINVRKENTKLAQLRDTLLPKLMSGELKIS